MTSRKYFFSTLKGLVTLIATLGLILIMLSFMNLSISLDSGHRVFTEHVKSLTGRDAHIDGELKLTVSLTPKLLVQRIHISNPDGIDDEYFITVSEAQVAVSLVPLLSGQLHFSDITAERAKINLTRMEDGSNNWSFDAFTQTSKLSETKTADNGTKKSVMDRLSLGALKLTNVAIVYSDESRHQVIETQIDQLIVDLENITKPFAEISGNIQDRPYSITFESDALDTFTAGGPWLLQGTGHIAGSKAALEANLGFNENEIEGEAYIEVNYINLGLLLETLGIISGQHTATEQVSIKAKIRGSDLAELFEQTEIKLQLGRGYWDLPSAATDQKKGLHFDSASTFASWNKPLELHIDGIAGGPWLLHGTGHIAGSKAALEANLEFNENEIDGEAHIKLNYINLGLLLETLGILSGQHAATEQVSIKAKIRGSDLAELFEQTEIKLQLGKGYWDLQSPATDQKKELFFSSASAFASWKKPLELHIDGIIDRAPFKLDFKTNRLMEFFDEIQKLDVDLKSSIADIDISLVGTLDLPIKTKQFHLYLSAKGKDLERLNTLINTEFPPLNDFTLAGDLIGNETGFIINSAVASIGDTQLQASIVIETNAPKPVWNINLSSRQLQLKDFAFDDWNIEKKDTAMDNTSNQNDLDKLLDDLLRQLEDRVRAPKTNFNLYLKVDKVLSGDEHLGKAKLLLHQHDNIFKLESVDMEIPGGRIRASLAFKAEHNQASGYAKLDIDRLDYGITARLLDPDSKADGVISTRVALQLGGSDFTRLLDQATGQLDIAIWPKSRRTEKLLDMWATNLFLMILPEINKKESRTNCMVALMDVDDGMMKEELFVFDTTKLWLHGNIEVDFKKDHVQLTLFPHSKKARIYALEAPMRVAGTFSDIQVIVDPADVYATTLAFVTSPLFAPLLRVVGDKVPEDGSAICGQLFDRAYTKSLKEQIKREEEKEIEEMFNSD